MKSNTIICPSLTQLYQQKNNYLNHKRKLTTITSEIASPRSANNHLGHMDKVRQNLQVYIKKNNSKSCNILRQNSVLTQKIGKIKSSLSFRGESNKSKELKFWRSLSTKSKMQEQQIQNSRISNKLKSAGPSISCLNLTKDYNKSVELKNRLMRFKIEANNKVVLKLDRYIKYSQHIPPNINSEILNRVDQYKQQRQQILDDGGQTSSRSIIQNKLGNVLKRGALKYTNRDIIKSKTDLDNQLFKLARQRRQKGLAARTKKWLIPSPSPINQPNNIFPTQPDRIVK